VYSNIKLVKNELKFVDKLAFKMDTDIIVKNVKGDCEQVRFSLGK